MLVFSTNVMVGRSYEILGLGSTCGGNKGGGKDREMKMKGFAMGFVLYYFSSILNLR